MLNQKEQMIKLFCNRFGLKMNSITFATLITSIWSRFQLSELAYYESINLHIIAELSLQFQGKS
jgi:hypothetical protein